MPARSAAVSSHSAVTSLPRPPTLPTTFFSLWDTVESHIQAFEEATSSNPASTLGKLRHINKHTFPDMPVDIFKAAAIHEAVILLGVDVGFAAVSRGCASDLVDRLSVLGREREHDLTLTMRIDDRLAREGRPLGVGEEHDEDAFRQHHAGGRVVTELRIPAGADSRVERRGLLEIAHRQIDKNLF